MQKYTRLVFLFSLLFIFCSGCSSASESSQNEDDSIDLTISAAISLTDALEDLKKQYEKEHDVNLHFNLGSSGKLAQQIQQGAPSDLYISANQEWMDTLEDESLIERSSQTNITANKLVVITANDSSVEIDDFSDVISADAEQIAIGNPDSVPAGKYAKQALNHLHMWDDMQDDIILAKDVRQVLTYVETENTDIGFVYESDAFTSDNVNIAAKAGDDVHDPITYPAAIVDDSDNKKAAQQFLDYLGEKDAQAIFQKYGFSQ